MLTDSAAALCNVICCRYPTTWWRRAYPPLPHVDDVTAVYPQDVGASSVADWCERIVQCSYEEELATPDVTPRWMELDTGGVPFSILRDPVSFNQYSGECVEQDA